jgi:hypothetical protein
MLKKQAWLIIYEDNNKSNSITVIAKNKTEAVSCLMKDKGQNVVIKSIRRWKNFPILTTKERR